MIRKVMPIALLLLGLMGSACGDDGTSAFGGSTTTGGGEVFGTTQTTSATTVTAAGQTTVTATASTTTTTTTTTTVPETTLTTAPPALGPTCTNESHGYTIAFPEGWHVDGEELNWGDFPSDDFACRLFGPNPFADLGLGGWEGWVADSAQAYITVQLTPHLGFGSVLFQDQGYSYAEEFADYLAGLPSMSVANLATGLWRVDGWVEQYRVYGYILEPWAACHPIVVGASSIDEALLLQLVPTVDAMLVNLTPRQSQPGAC